MSPIAVSVGPYSLMIEPFGTHDLSPRSNDIESSSPQLTSVNLVLNGGKSVQFWRIAGGIIAMVGSTVTIDAGPLWANQL
jgi:hypothetical protein